MPGTLEPDDHLLEGDRACRECEDGRAGGLERGLV